MYLRFFTDKNDEGKRRYITINTKTEKFNRSSFDWAKKDGMFLSRGDFIQLEIELENWKFQEVKYF